jgi:hypothetical protein
MYLLFVLVLGLTPDEDLGRGPPDTAHLALRERQHSCEHRLCKHQMGASPVFRPPDLTPYPKIKYSGLPRLPGSGLQNRFAP